MLVIRGGENHSVDILVFEQLSIIGVGRRRDAGLFASALVLRQDLAIDVANRDQPRARQLVQIISHVARALAADTESDDSNADISIRATGGRRDLAIKPGVTGEKGGATANERGFEELFTCP